jgi:hypothetical protein
MRAAEEPLRSDLDVAGLKAQVLGRIEELEARKREREDLLVEITAMEARGHDTGAIKAMMGGLAAQPIRLPVSLCGGTRCCAICLWVGWGRGVQLGPTGTAYTRNCIRTSENLPSRGSFANTYAKRDRFMLLALTSSA